ncbi:MAG TPA: dicarboxylate/amino acid:cation symporter, partial [Corynebacterium falsenii]|nr:dicarboxylate/amino acid:cation symporter [Corynebacterium falsenii]
MASTPTSPSASTPASPSAATQKTRRGRNRLLPQWMTGFGAQVIAGLIIGLILGFI